MRHEAQSTTNLGSSAIWTTNSLAPVVVNGQYTVTNPVSGSDHLLVTNVEAGTISVFDDGGSFLGNLQDPSGQDIVLIGIWSSVFDNGDGNPKMFYSAGCDFPPDSPSLFGYVTIAAPQDK